MTKLIGLAPAPPTRVPPPRTPPPVPPVPVVTQPAPVPSPAPVPPVKAPVPRPPPPPAVCKFGQYKMYRSGYFLYVSECTEAGQWALPSRTVFF